jgi:YD repeat-containing protein
MNIRDDLASIEPCVLFFSFVVGGVTTTMEYDIRGNKTKMNDPDMGTWTYSYNALGKLVSQTDAKGQTSGC